MMSTNNEQQQVSIEAQPAVAVIAPSTTALIMIDMQRDFLEPGGLRESLGNDVSVLRKAIGPCGRLLTACIDVGLFVVHTREGHRPELSDLPRYDRQCSACLNILGIFTPRRKYSTEERNAEPWHDPQITQTALHTHNHLVLVEQL